MVRTPPHTHTRTRRLEKLTASKPAWGGFGVLLPLGGTLTGVSFFLAGLFAFLVLHAVSRPTSRKQKGQHVSPREHPAWPGPCFVCWVL